MRSNPLLSASERKKRPPNGGALIQHHSKFINLVNQFFIENTYPLVHTENNKYIFAFAANEDKTEYKLYRWNSTTGWVLEKSYSFADGTDLVLTNINKHSARFNWAFWTNKTNALSVYKWTQADGYNTLTTRDLDCNAQCIYTLDVSRKEKVFFAWVNQPTVICGCLES